MRNLITTIQTVLIVLKLTSTIDYSWVLIFVPTYFLISVYVIFMIMVAAEARKANRY